MKPDDVEYSEELKGDRGNYNMLVRFDINGSGYLGITQTEVGQDSGPIDRVLLSPAQVKALKVFLRVR